MVDETETLRTVGGFVEVVGMVCVAGGVALGLLVLAGLGDAASVWWMAWSAAGSFISGLLWLVLAEALRRLGQIVEELRRITRGGE